MGQCQSTVGEERTSFVLEVEEGSENTRVWGQRVSATSSWAAESQGWVVRFRWSLWYPFPRRQRDLPLTFGAPSKPEVLPVPASFP